MSSIAMMSLSPRIRWILGEVYGVDSKLNPYDLYALEMALRVREKAGGDVRTISMGPPQAISALEETLAIGADSAVLLSDRRFAGADVYATSYTLCMGIKKMQPYDIIICGKQTTDGDTAQVGPELAEMLGIEHATGVIEINRIDEKAVTVTINLDDRFQVQQMCLPCLLTIEKDACMPRLPSFKRKKQVLRDMIKCYGADDLDQANISRFGLKGSLTQVERIFPPAKNTEKRLLEGSKTELQQELYALLEKHRFI